MDSLSDPFGTNCLPLSRRPGERVVSKETTTSRSPGSTSTHSINEASGSACRESDAGIADRQTSVIDYPVKRSHDKGQLQSTVRLFGQRYGGRISNDGCHR